MRGAREMRSIALIPLVAYLIPCSTVAGPPVPDQFGRVVDADTGSPIALRYYAMALRGLHREGEAEKVERRARDLER